MCGRYTFVDVKEIYERYQVNNRVDGLAPRYNVTPGSLMPVILKQSPTRIKVMKWGLVPAWAKDPQIGYRMINARAETIMEKPTYRKAFQTQRCLVPANGFYEWDHSTKPGRPYYFTIKEEMIFSLAGLFDKWIDAEQKEWWTYTIMTTAANNSVNSVHIRMPVVVSRQDEILWMNKETSIDSLNDLLVKGKTTEFVKTPVGLEVNNPANDKPSLIEPLHGSMN
jgi:putative SOS response-associated peptidase YedK